MTIRRLRTVVLLGIMLLTLLPASGVVAQNLPPYAGETDRTIKALSDEDVEGYLAGKGMGLAKAAELNRYPGPRHVIDLADTLALSPDQLAAAQRLFNAMRAEAVALGTRIVEEERRLDSLFAVGAVRGDDAARIVAVIAELQGRLRFAHLNAHIAMRDMLTDEQVTRYDRLRHE